MIFLRLEHILRLTVIFLVAVQLPSLGLTGVKVVGLVEKKPCLRSCLLAPRLSHINMRLIQTILIAPCLELPASY
jgi:hypothetical protein